MDCEGFDGVALDLVDDDGRRDARAVEDAKRHAEGCTRCAAALRSLRAAREAVRLPPLALPDGLEARILAAARRREREARSGWWQRLDLFISRAGAYAMRPQPAMALVLLLMVGSSLFLLRARPEGLSRVSVTERGVPIPRAAEKGEAAPESAAPAAASAAPAPTAIAQRDEERNVAKMEGARDGRERGGSDTPAPKGAAESDGPSALREFSPAPPRPAEAPPAVAAAPAPPPAAAMGRADAAAAQAAPGVAATATATATATPSADATFSTAMDDYKARRFAEAQRGFDLIVSEGGAQAPLAALYAARSVRYTAGCSAAVNRFDSVANRFTGTSIAAEAMWEGALCYRELGQYDRSRQLYLALRRVAGYRERVDRELAELDQRPAVGGGGARPGVPARAAPAPRPAARPAAEPQNAEFAAPPPHRPASPAPPPNADVERAR
ncbi:MAG TPA: hypothetical protein VFS43_35010 [Polyangiaceae bacterium]|nr:hypothetical protein [Polyangiaceae bacterium]